MINYSLILFQNPVHSVCWCSDLLFSIDVNVPHFALSRPRYDQNAKPEYKACFHGRYVKGHDFCDDVNRQVCMLPCKHCKHKRPRHVFCEKVHSDRGHH